MIWESIEQGYAEFMISFTCFDRVPAYGAINPVSYDWHSLQCHTYRFPLFCGLIDPL